MTKFYLFIVYLFILLNKSLSQQTTAIADRVCIEGVIDKLSLTQFTKNAQDEYVLCGSSYISCLQNGSVTSLYLTKTFLLNDPGILESVDIDCLSVLSTLRTENIRITEDFIYYKYRNLKNLDISTQSLAASGITGVIPPLDRLSITHSAIALVNKAIKLSYLVNVVDCQLINGGYIIEGDNPGSSIIRTKSLTIGATNFPDFTYYSSIDNLKFYFNGNGFNESSISNFSTIGSKTVYMQHNIFDSQVPFYLDKNNKINSISLFGYIQGPSNDIPYDLRSTNYTSIKIYSAGPSFVLSNGQLPLLINKDVDFLLSNSQVNSFPLLSEYGGKKTFSISQSQINQTLPSFNGTGYYYSFDLNQITGTIDNSWCNTELSVTSNKLTGTIPSCFTCYFNVTSILVGQTLMYDRFYGNNFTNYNKSMPCTTFKPQITVIDDVTIKFHGIDIGYNPNRLSIKVDKMFIGLRYYQIVTPGKEYIMTIDQLFLTLEGIDYFGINFYFPDVIYTFPRNSSIPPKISSILYDNSIGNQITISGSHFASYIGQDIQTVTIGGIEYIIDSLDFFNIICSSNLILPLSPTNKYLLSVTTGSKQTKYYINAVDFNLNINQCKSQCNGNQICDMTIGQCVCDTGAIFNGCPHYVTSINSTTTNGGIAIFNGYFGDIHKDLSITIGNVDCSIIDSSVTTNQIQCTAAAGKGIQRYSIVQNGYTISGDYQYIETIQQCPLNCSGNGVCNTNNGGQCTCNIGYSSYDCSVKDDGGNKPSTNTTIDPINGGTNTEVQEINFSIYFKSLSEIDINGNPIEVHSLQNNWKLNDSNIQNQFTFKQTIQNSTCSIISTIEEIKDEQGKQFEFAGTSFKLDQGSIKFTISILNYNFKNNLNTLQLDLISMVNENQESECNSKDTEIDTINQSTTFNYIKISKNNKILSGRFINKLISDGNPTFLSTKISKEKESIIVSLSLPHCTECQLDPDFSVIISNDYKSECGDSRKWVIPVAVVVPVVGSAFLGGAALFIYKRYFVEAKLRQMLKIKMNNMQ